MEGLSAGICMANRHLNCLLCQKNFSRMTADALFPADLICDDCIADYGQFEKSDLRQRVSQRLGERKEQQPELVETIVKALQEYKK